MELEWTFGWTLAAAAAGWVVFSFAAALFLGRMIRRSEEAMLEPEAREQPAAPSAEARRFLDVLADNDAVYEPGDEGSTRTSGTRIKPVHVSPEQLPERVRRIR